MALRAILACFPIACLAACATPGLEAPRIVAAAAGIECHAAPDASRPQMIVGYGSLMEDASREHTSPRAGAAHPVEITGFRRGWFSRGSSVGFSTTYLGVIEEPQARLNAVAYRVDPAELAATDAREASYCRAIVARGDLRPLERGFSLPAGAQAWIYVGARGSAMPPDARFPIVQSYVDVFLSGCFEQEERHGIAGFAAECVATTAGWSAYWVNDRIFPRRPFIHEPRARQIDELLAARLGELFSRIRIEAGS
jgi:hypothetical protein